MATLRGALVVGQSGGPTAVINNSLVGVIEQSLLEEQVTAVYGSLRGIQGVLQDRMVDLGRESPQTLSRLRRTPGAALGTVRYKLQEEDYERVVEVLRAHDVRFFCYIGGNDSMDTAHRVDVVAQRMGYELRSIGVPKTVDNDLAGTDHCPGYGSAARFVALAARDTGWDTESMGPSSPVKIIEIMGRNAGWLTATAALARQEPGDPPHLIYVPERPVDDAKVVGEVGDVVAAREHCVIALSEGAVPDAGMGEVDAFGHQMKGGAAEYLERVLSDQLGLKVRIDKPNYLQRCFSTCISDVDANEAYMVGQSAVRLAVDGKTGVMVTLVRVAQDPYQCETGTVPLEQVANAERLLPDVYLSEQGDDVTPAFLDYARPLIGPPPPPLARLARYAAPRAPLV
jgi:ATP-dependent phosphofructokinase / diphosphate-dependent phosphofructokinase